MAVYQIKQRNINTYQASELERRRHKPNRQLSSGDIIKYNSPSFSRVFEDFFPLPGKDSIPLSHASTQDGLFGITGNGPKVSTLVSMSNLGVTVTLIFLVASLPCLWNRFLSPWVVTRCFSIRRASRFASVTFTNDLASLFTHGEGEASRDILASLWDLKRSGLPRGGDEESRDPLRPGVSENFPTSSWTRLPPSLPLCEGESKLDCRLELTILYLPLSE